VLLRAQVRDVKMPDAPAKNAVANPAVTLLLDESAFQSIHSQHERLIDRGYIPTPHSSGYFEKKDIIDNHNNVARLTGRVALGRMPEADPFLQPERDFLFLARFDGVTKEESRTLAVVTVIKYFIPKAMLVQ